MGHASHPLLRLRIAGPLALVAAFLSPAARADEMLLRDIVWPRHNRETSFLEWELRARTARPLSTSEYRCIFPEISTYRLTEDGGVKRTRREMYLRADEATYKHHPDRPTATLKGNVKAILYGADDPVHITTSEAVLRSIWNDATKTREREITSADDAKVNIASESGNRNLTGEGLTVFELIRDVRGRKPVIEKSQVILRRNVQMTIRGEHEASFPAMPGAPQAPGADSAPPPVSISCVGSLVADRITNQACFRDHVILERAGVRITADILTIDVAESLVSGKRELRLTKAVAEKDVVIANADHRLTGARFEWDPAASESVMRGAPATLAGPGIRGTAAAIAVNQKTQVICFAGDAVVQLEVKPSR